LAQKAIVFSALVIVAFQSFEAQQAAKRRDRPDTVPQPHPAGALEGV
jgi:hypothetical protein